MYASCSDKIAKWQLLGWQGALLSGLLKEPIRLASIVCGARTELLSASIQDPGNPSKAEHVPATRHQSVENTKDSIDPAAFASQCRHQGHRHRRIGAVRDGSAAELCYSTSNARSAKAQEAAMVRAIFDRCKRSWEAIMDSFAQQEVSSATAGVRQAGSCEETTAARSLVEGWINSPPEVGHFA